LLEHEKKKVEQKKRRRGFFSFPVSQKKMGEKRGIKGKKNCILPSRKKGESLGGKKKGEKA